MVELGLVGGEVRPGDPSDASASRAKAARAPPPSSQLNRAQALRSPIFWALSLAIFLVELYWTGVNFNLLLLLSDALDEASILRVMVVIGVTSAAASASTGVVAERLQRRRRLQSVPHRRGLLALVAVQMGMTASSAVALCFVDGMGSAVLWAVLFSTMIGIQDIVMLLAFAEIFGKTHIGSIMGVVTFVMTLATATGPMLGAACVQSGVLTEVLLVPVAVVSAVVGVACLCVPDPAGAAER